MIRIFCHAKSQEAIYVGCSRDDLMETALTIVAAFRQVPLSPFRFQVTNNKPRPQYVECLE
jgi:hypothetical protein